MTFNPMELHMAATQISFVAFAQSVCTSPLSPEMVPDTGRQVGSSTCSSQGECAELAAYRADFSEFRRLTALADETVTVPFARWSRGGFVLAALANYRTPCDSAEESAGLLDNLRYQAAYCIGQGC